MFRFTTLKAHPALRDLIRGYWLIESGPQPERLELVPDGYPEMFFTLGGSMQIFSEKNRRTAFSPAGLIGQATGRFAFESSAFSRVFYVKLYPWTPRVLFGVPAWKLNDTVSDVFGLTGDAEFRALNRQVYAAAGLPEIVGLLDAFFLKKAGERPRENAFLQFAIRQIYASNGTVSIDSLLCRIRTSRRYLEKTFREYVGMSPKEYAQIIRVKKASMYLLDPRFRGNILEIANRLDYYDQSHLLKDFKAVVHQAPSEFLRSQLNISEDDVLAYLSQWDYS
jgi:AraC-like DNA-binding protein